MTPNHVKQRFLVGAAKAACDAVRTDPS